MLQKIRYALKILGINLAVMLSAVLVVEILGGHWFQPIPRFTQFTCFDEITHHRYCRNIHHINHLAAEDGGDLISTFVGRDAIPVANAAAMKQEIRPADYDIILVGDSFIQGDEVDYSLRLGSLLADRTGRMVLANGYSSWAPVIQTNWLMNQTLRPGQKVLYFVMANDFGPLYPNSNLHYHRRMQKPAEQTSYFLPDRADEPKEALPLSTLESLQNRSFFLFRLTNLLKQWKTPPQLGSVKLINESFLEPHPDCQGMKNRVQSLGFSKLWIWDYIVFSQPLECWDSEHVAELDTAIQDIEKAQRFLEKQGISMQVVYIPAGWAFPGENLLGKKTEQFSLAANAVVGSQGLAQALDAALRARDIPFLDLEKELNIYKKATKQQPLYMPVDGHWNVRGHAVVADIIYDRVLKGGIIQSRREAR